MTINEEIRYVESKVLDLDVVIVQSFAIGHKMFSGVVAYDDQWLRRNSKQRNISTVVTV